MKACLICQCQHTVTVPVVHLNGTAAIDLLEPLDKALAAIRDAMKAVGRTAPNGRDYYLTNNLQMAIKDHCLREEKLVQVATELSQIRDHIEETVNLNTAARLARQ